MRVLTLSLLKIEAGNFVQELRNRENVQLYGITDGKAVGTYVEQIFNQYLEIKYLYTPGSAATDGNIRN
ncbi:hypothetical protein [Limnoraphis robusta]|uniref:Uncharacterized protein n=1 Tax=Limnoraphis robusta CCNP1315 TaxID=3110306 RepID=A0ABU5TS71_9CYAN|nr:hypothetical protein [Limnoraphis robusta]MEA5517730.1 hypothetical protein [Limnoraphis robusta CCNP1315]MEA5546281.1 hypothetical protein [Limnoraphis robusta CCNP1324]